jgi:fumarylacetoacetase
VPNIEDRGPVVCSFAQRGLPSDRMAIDFGRETLPYCVFSDSAGPWRIGVGVGEDVVDLRAAAGHVTSVSPDILRSGRLNALLGTGAPVWSELRSDLLDLVRRGILDQYFMSQDEVKYALAWDVADYVDFYSSQFHAENVGRIFRPEAPDLPDNWLHLPAGYHGRSSTVVVDGTPVRRPVGQIRTETGEIVLGPSRMLDFELELGFVLGGRTDVGQPVPISQAHSHLFGVVLVNDWSARDIQAWEYVPLGPFLGKSFATSVSSWVVPFAALTECRVAGPVQDPEPLSYLRTPDQWGLDTDLEVWIRPAGASVSELVATVNAAEGLYWNPAQQLAHMTVNGASVSPGDLFASGTVSGPSPNQRGSLLELSWGGTREVQVGDVTRTFLLDGDEVIFQARTNSPAGHIPLGPVSGRVIGGKE